MPLLAAIGQHKEPLSTWFQSSYGDWLETVVLHGQHQPSREAAALGIHQLCQGNGIVLSGLEGDPSPPRHLILTKLLEFLPRFKLTENHSENPIYGKCAEYFGLLSKLVRDTCIVGENLSENFTSLLHEALTMICTHPILETNAQSPEDKILMGLLSLVRTLVTCDPSVKSSVGNDLIPEVFHRCLFDIPSLDHHGPNPPRCKTAASRQTAFSLLLELIRDCQENMLALCHLLIDHHRHQPYKKQWQYHPQSYEKAACGYVGMKNLGCTCYMNSLVQQFYMIPQFRCGVLQVDNKAEEKSESVLYQLQSIFANLQESEKKYYDARDFCLSYKVDGEPIKVNEQQDVDEFLVGLIDRLENILKGTPQEKLLQNCFGGTVVNQIISKECDHRSERSETCYTLQLEVKNKHKLVESLDLFVQGDMLDGDNKYFCDKCETKVAALKRCCIGKLPNCLVIHLKRFEFDLELMRRNKVNQFCSFTHTLNLEPYTSEGLERREKAEQGGPLPPPIRPLSSYDYELTGILVHAGTTESGHYYSFAADRRTKQWYSFNDVNVTPFDTAQIPDHCFGGTETQYVWDAERRREVARTVPRTYSAYLLFYERCQPETLPVEPPVTDLSKVVPRELYDQVWDKNLKFLMDKYLFDRDYLTFVQDLVGMFDPEKNSKNSGKIYESAEMVDSDTRFAVIQLGTRFLIQALAHAQNKKSLPGFVGLLKRLYEGHLPSCQWFIRTLMESPEWVVQMLLRCTLPDTREEFAKLVAFVARQIDVREGNLYGEEDPLPPVAISKKKKGKAKTKNKKEDDGGWHLLRITGVPKNTTLRFIETVLKLHTEARGFWNNYDQYFFLLQEFTKFGTPMRRAMISRGYIKFLCHFYLGDESPYYTGKKEKKSKEKIQQEKTAAQNAKYLLDVVSTLVRSCRLPREGDHVATDARSPDQTDGDSLDLPPDDETLALGNAFISKTLADDSNPEAIATMVRHASWENMTASRNFINITCEGVSKYDWDRFPPFNHVLRALLRIEDGLRDARVLYAMSRYLRVILSNLKWKTATKAALVFLLEVVRENPVASRFLWENREEWVPKLLMFNTCREKNEIEEHVRFIVEYLILEMFPEIRSYVVLDIPGLELIPVSVRRKEEDEPTYEELSPEVITRLQQILHLLFSQLGPISKMPYEVGQPDPKSTSAESETCAFRLISLFRLLRWGILSESEQYLFLESTYKSDFISLFYLVDDKQIECDLNKSEMFYFWKKVTSENKAVTLAFLENPHFRRRFIECSIRLNDDTNTVLYNDMWIRDLYDLHARYIAVSETFLHELSDSENFEWAVNNIVLDSLFYPHASLVIIQVLVVLLKRLDEEYRKWWTSRILDTGLARHGNFMAAVEIVTQALQFKPEQIYFCSFGGLSQLSEVLNKRKEWSVEELKTILLAALSATSWFLDEKLSQEERTTRSEINSMKILFKRFIEFIPHIKTEYVDCGKYLLQFLRQGIQGDTPLALWSIDLFNNEVYRSKRYSWDPRLVIDDEWWQLLVTFVNDLCKKAFTENPKPNTLLSTFNLASKNGLEALMLPFEMVSTVVNLLQSMWCNKDLQTMIMSVRSPFFEFVPRLIGKWFEWFFERDKLLYKFVAQVFPHIHEQVQSDVKQEVLAILEEKFNGVLHSIQSNNQSKQYIVKELVLLYSIIEVVFVDPTIQQFIRDEFDEQLAGIKQILDERAENGWGEVPEIDELVELVKKVGV